MSPAAPDPLIGRQVRDLRILDLIGRGGMGAVYRAQHVLLHETRALKVIRKGSITIPDAVERFQREARLAVRLRHPNLVLVHDFFIEDGDYYLVMEYVAGQSLGKRIRSDGPIEAEAACELGIRCCAGLGYAHELSIVHRDLTPENILLTPTARGVEPKIIDFGIARAMVTAADEQKTEVDVTLTRVGGFVGKPRYASPEQAGRLRSGEQIDARSDLYTFGLVLYEMVTADLPFHSDSEIGYLPLHYSAPPARPTAVRPDLGIPLSLERVILRCLEKERGDRFQSAAELAQALQGVLRELARGEAPTLVRPARAAAPTRITTPPTEVETPSAPRARGTSFVIAGLVGLVVALASMLLIRLWQEQRAGEPVPIAPAAQAAAPALAEDKPAPPVTATADAAPAAPAAADTTLPVAASAPPPAPAAPPVRVEAPKAPDPAPAPERRAAARPQPKPAPATAPAPAPVLGPPPLPADGPERYTLVNLHPRRGLRLSTVHQGTDLLPLCTKVHIDQTGPDRVHFTVVETGDRYVYERWKRRVDLAQHLTRVLGTSCPLPRVRALSPTDQAGISEGRVRLGMTKEGVALAVGYPAEHATPSLDSDTWRYWTEATRRGSLIVTFENGVVSAMTPYR